MRLHENLSILVGVLLTACSSTPPEAQLDSVPAATSPQIEAAQNFTITVEEDQSLSVDGKAVTVEGLGARLSELGGNGSQSVLVRAHRKVRHSVIAAIMDQLEKAGYSRVSLATTSG